MEGRGNILIDVLTYRTGQARQPCWKCNGSLIYYSMLAPTLLEQCSLLNQVHFRSCIWKGEREKEKEKERNLLKKEKKAAAYNWKGIVQSQSLAPLKHWTLIQRNKYILLRRLITIVHKKLPSSLGKLSTPSQRSRHFVIQCQKNNRPLRYSETRSSL